jgi:hypothetical protein
MPARIHETKPGDVLVGRPVMCGHRQAVEQMLVRVDSEATTGHDRAGLLGHGQDGETWLVGEAVAAE